MGLLVVSFELVAAEFELGAGEVNWVIRLCFGYSVRRLDIVVVDGSMVEISE